MTSQMQLRNNSQEHSFSNRSISRDSREYGSNVRSSTESGKFMRDSKDTVGRSSYSGSVQDNVSEDDTYYDASSEPAANWYKDDYEYYIAHNSGIESPCVKPGAQTSEEKVRQDRKHIQDAKRPDSLSRRESKLRDAQGKSSNPKDIRSSVGPTLASGGISRMDEDRGSTKESIISSLSSQSDLPSQYDRSQYDSAFEGSEPPVASRFQTSPSSKGTQKQSTSQLDAEIVANYNKNFRVSGYIQNKLLKNRSRYSKSQDSDISSYIDLDKYTQSQDSILSDSYVKLSQVLRHHEGPIWVMKFSPDGKYLCSAGQDAKVIVWIVGTVPFSSTSSSISNLNMYEDIDDSSHDSKEENSNQFNYIQSKSLNSNDNIIHPVPYRVFEGHTSDVVDIAWSRSNFILTASLDKTVCLWLVSRHEMMKCFRHPDIVTCVDFHPIHDHLFISGSFDCKLRLWEILPNDHVRAWAQTPETITAVSFDPSGQNIVGGLLSGQLFFYTFDMKYITQLNCKNRSGKYRSGRKVTGISFVRKESYLSGLHMDSNAGTNYRAKIGNLREKLIVTTNDSRIRLIQTEDYSLVNKYFGLKNTSMQIKASLSDDNRFVISGSEDGKIYLWHTSFKPSSSWLSVLSKHKNYTNCYYESIDVTETAVTAAIFAPSTTIYHTLMNHPKYYAMMRNREEDYDLSQISDMIRKFDPILSNHRIDNNSFSSRIIVAADYDGQIHIYLRQDKNIS